MDMAFNILLVDDSSIVRKSLTKTIGMAEIEVGEVLEAENGQAALDVLRHHWVDLIFLDINMPVMNGLEFLHLLRADPKLRDIAVIIISTEGSKIRAEELKALGITAQLHKPVRPESLTETVMQALGGGSQ